MYVRIRNRTEGVNRLFLEKLGLSTKRDDDSTIGQFGSGSKYAPIYALRKGYEWINCGEDDNGPYQMRYGVVDDGGINTVVFDYGNGVVKESSFTLEAGMLTWENDFQLFREAFANCLDSGYDEDIAISFVDDIDWEPGFFDVYLTASPEIVEIASNIDHYFSVNREPKSVVHHYSNTIKCYDPITPGTLRVYSKGVLVYEKEKTFACFDYEIRDIVLNEERTIRSEMDLQSSICNFMMECDHDIADIYVRDVKYERWEWFFPSYYYHGNSKIADRWVARFGEKAVPVNKDLAYTKPHLKIKGYKAVDIDFAGAMHLLRNSNVLTVEEALGAGFEFNIIEPSRRQEEVINQAARIVNNYGIDLAPFEVFKPDSNQTRIYGMVIRGDIDKIYISERAVDEGLGCLVATMVHELDHYHSGYGDSDPEFRDIADRRMAEMMVAGYKSSYDIVDGKCIIPLADIKSSMTYRVFDCGDFGMIEFDNRRFMVDADCVPDSGSLAVMDDNHFYFHIKTEGAKAVEV